MSATRARILARRAAFVAAALRSVGEATPARADEAPPVAPPVAPPAPPDVGPGPCLAYVPPPPIEPPRVCLSPPHPPPVERDAWDIGVAAATPVVLLPVARSAEPEAVGALRVGALWAVFVQRQLPVGALRLSVRSGYLRVTSDAPVPVGGALGFFSDVRPSYLDFHHRFTFGVELGGGAFFGDATRPYLEVAATPLNLTLYAMRGDSQRTSRFLTLGLRGAMLLVDTGPLSDRAFGVRAFTLGIDLTFGLQIVRGSVVRGFPE